MFSLKKGLAVAAASVLSLMAIAAGGASQPLLASDEACVLGGTGQLCQTITTQTCMDWTTTGITVGVTGGGGSTSCSYWLNTTTYYYWEQGTGGLTIKAPVK